MAGTLSEAARAHDHGDFAGVSKTLDGEGQEDVGDGLIHQRRGTVITRDADDFESTIALSNAAADRVGISEPFRGGGLIDDGWYCGAGLGVQVPSGEFDAANHRKAESREEFRAYGVNEGFGRQDCRW